ncbi:LacI family DNA-binding transcriptional regulator [Asticcacaulis excentricus]|uniref:Transcriptional regulator, LacI family n=1 Tax=Asticcacaulis excentricus (strain ATCC 15261 / DSM 4724 / KCTC 12464 / NCIMB 9791 / VKM B-1370 / CB 48) TaxID=573065 RepID=E8RM49_ASTEC|nr:LacI family DNA-binding transcriptional regulator [Asticcacaulis excentricus]ADU12741.1 transcriptional regulator, LacI family [Asticcacaulis excentricus CB 48]
MKTAKPTIDDVAALSGVARTTVSRVLNNGPNVRPEVRARVLEAVEKLQYKVNAQARFLAGGRSQLLALLHASDLDAEPNSYYYSGLELGALRACAPAGFQLLMHAVNQHSLDRTQKICAFLASRRCDGVILTPPYSDDPVLHEALLRLNIAHVAVSPGDNLRTQVAGVGMDDEVAGYEITRYLLGLGHRRFAFLQGLESHASAESRFAGYRRALIEAGLSAEAMATARGNFTFRSGADQSIGLLKAPDRPTALICANDDMATGALFAAHRMGLTLPADLSVVGFDDTPVSEVVWPPLTTIHQPIRQIGARAVEKLIDVLNGTESNESGFEVVPHRLIVRESAAPV